MAAGQQPRAGVRMAAVDDGTPIVGAISGNQIDVGRFIPMTDESRPSQVVLGQVAMRDHWDDSGATDVDSLFFTWSESVGDDGDQYFVFITETTPVNITNEWMNANLARAIPLGNLRSMQIDGETQIGLVVQPDEGQPAVPGAITAYTDESDPSTPRDRRHGLHPPGRRRLHGQRPVPFPAGGIGRAPLRFAVLGRPDLPPAGLLPDGGR